jgi:hypothetical protein
MPLKKKQRQRLKRNVTESLSGYWQELLGHNLAFKLIKEAHNDIPALIKEERNPDTKVRFAKISQAIKAAHKRGAYAHRKRLARSASAAT